MTKQTAETRDTAMRPRDRPSTGLVLGGGAARGLAHIGVLEVLEREGVRIDFIAGSSMGGLIGALSASGLRAGEIEVVAREFYFPRWFVPGGLLSWDSLFSSAIPALSGAFEDLETQLVVVAVDLEEGCQVLLHSGPLLPAIRATCSVPGVLPAVKLDGRWLVDGGLLNVLPVDAAWMADPDVVIAVKAGATTARPLPQLDWPVTNFVSRLGGMIPNPATAAISFEVLVRAAEIILDRQTALATAMTGPEVLIEPELGDLALRDFDRLDDAMSAGRRAAEAALPEIVRAIESPRGAPSAGERLLQLRFDPVCGMVISPSRARGTSPLDGITYYFCSANCLDCFERDPDRYLRASTLASGNVRRRAPGTAKKKGTTRGE